ncbi:hypothetical protein ACFVXG_45565 [Kitasatospora sp. NPDC058162]|uniref:hypothetical protein n=1 Tax=Kitasatospora sp. NPDC058162 TaxID=3346362 RepID=UPI0036D7990F
MEIREEAQVAALREVAEIGAKRAALLEQAAALLGELEPVAIKAIKAGALRNRVRELAQVSPTTLYAWLENAGMEVRPKKAPAKKTTTKKATS